MLPSTVITALCIICTVVAAQLDKQDDSGAILGATVTESYGSGPASLTSFHKADNKYCGSNWGTDYAARDTTMTSHQGCIDLCNADKACVAAAVHANGCVKCKLNSIDHGSGTLHTHSGWTTYTKAPLPCVTPADYGIAWRNTESWCKDNAGSSETTSPKAKQSPEVVSNGVKHFTMLRAGVQWVETSWEGVTSTSMWICGCKANEYRLNYPESRGWEAASTACDSMLGDIYCPVDMPFESGSVITGCLHSAGFNPACGTSPTFPSFFS